MANEEEIRYPYVAGAFYPADKNELSTMIDGFLSKVPSNREYTGDIAALVVPHAGYIFSGQTAAYGYRLISKNHYDTVVLLGPYHEALFHGASIWKSGVWKTPLGEVPVDAELAGAIIKENESFAFTQNAHSTEHSLEVQLPFLQKVMSNFKIVPILISDPSPEGTRPLAQAIYKNIQGKNALIIASTDMSHYYDDSTARKMDDLTLELLRKKDTDGLLREMNLKHSELCGIAATLVVLEISKLMPGADLEVLNYSNSGDSTGDRSRVVGYGASVIYRNPKKDAVAEEKKEALPANANDPEKLSEGEGKELIKIACQTVEQYVRGGKMPQLKVSDPVLKKDRAVFVTLKEFGNLRGCIGSIMPEEPLYLAVRDMAVESASHDPRFRPVTTQELKNIKVELSVLSVPQKIDSVDKIRLGEHGVILKKDFQSGVFLPKVATETGWTKEEFLNELCSQKAGLPSDCWKDPATEIYTFTSQDFSE